MRKCDVTSSLNGNLKFNGKHATLLVVLLLLLFLADDDDDDARFFVTLFVLRTTK